MGTTIDRNIVQMEFDNDGFKDGCTETISLIDKLKSALKFDKVEESFNGLTAAANKVDLSGISDNLDQIANRFSTMGIIAATTIARFTNEAINMVTNLGKKITRLTISGGISRAMNIEKAKFQLQGLGIAWDEIKDDIDYGVKDTAYGLDAAANVASQLVASGVKIGDDMKATLRAISGVAAMTNSSYEEIGNVFTTVAGQGVVMTMQLRQLESRGLNAAAQLGKALGKSEAEIREMVHKGQIDFATFSKAMNDAFGEHAKEANRTFNGVISNIKSALARIGAEFIQPLIENDGPLVTLLESIRVKINEIKEQILPLAHYFTQNVSAMAKAAQRFVESINVEGSFDKFTYAVGAIVRISKALLPTVKKVFGLIRDTFNEVFPKKDIKDFRKQIDNIVDSVKKFSLSSDTLVKLRNTFKGLFSTIKLAGRIFKNLLVVFSPVLGILKTIASAILDVTSFIGKMMTVLAGEAKAIDEFGEVGSKVLETIGKTWGKIKENIKHGLEEIADKKYFWGIYDLVTGTLIQAFYGFLDVVEEVTGLDLSRLRNTISGFIEIVNENFSKFVTSIEDGSNKVVAALEFIGDTIKSVFSKIAKRFEELTGIDLTKLGETIKKVVEYVDPLGKVEDIFNGFDKAKEKVEKLSGSLEYLKDLLKQLLESAVDGISEILENPILTLTSLTGLSFIGSISDFVRNINQLGGIKGFFATLTESLKAMTSKVAVVKVENIAKALMLFSFSIVALAYAVKTLSDIDDVAQMLTIIGALIGGIYLLVKAFNQLQSKTSGMEKGGKAESIKKGLLGFIGIDQDVSKLIGTSIALVVMASAVVILAKATKILSEAMSNFKNPMEFIAAVMTIAGFIAVIYIFANKLIEISEKLSAFPANSKQLIAIGITLLLISKSIESLVSSLAGLAFISDGNWLAALEGLIGLVSIMLVLMLLMKKITEFVSATMSSGADKKIFSGLRKVALILLAFSASVKLLASSVMDLSTLSAEQLFKAIGGITELMFALAWLASSMDVRNLSKAAFGLLALGIAVKMMAKAFKTMGEMSFEDVMKGIFAMVAICFDLSLVLITIQDKMRQAAITIFAVAASVWILSKSISMLADAIGKDPEGTVLGFGYVIALLHILVRVANQLGETQSIKGAVGIIAMAVALRILTKCMTILGSIDPVNAGLNLMVLVLALYALKNAAEKLADLKAGAGILGILGLAIALKIMAKSMQILQGIQFWDVIQGIVAIAVALVALIAASLAINNSGAEIAALSMAALGAAMYLLAKGIQTLAGVPFGPAATGVILLVGALIMLTVVALFIGASSSAIFIGAAAIALFGIAVGVAAAAIGAGMLVISLALQGVILAIEKLVSGFIDLSGAINQDLLNRTHIFSQIAGLLTIAFLSLFVATTVLGVGFLVLGVGAAALGVGMIVGAAGVALMVGALKLLREFLPEVYEAWFGTIQSVESGGKEFDRTARSIDKATDSSVNSLQRLRNENATLKQQMAEQDQQYREQEVENLLKFQAANMEANRQAKIAEIDRANTLIDSQNATTVSTQQTSNTYQQELLNMYGMTGQTTEGITNYFDSMANNNQIAMANMDTNISGYSLDAAGNFNANTVGMIGSLDALTGSTDADVNQIINSFGRMDSMTGVSLQSTGSKFDNFMNTIGFERLGSNMTTRGSNLGTNFVNGLLKGLNNGKSNVSTAGSNLATSAMNGFALRARIHSPSKVGEWLGSMFDMGVVLGIDKDADQVANSTENLAAQAEGALLTSMSLMHDKLLGDMSEPVITPVIDMSNIQNGADRLNTMFGQKYASTISASYKTNREYSDEAAAANYANMAAIGSQLTGAINANNAGNLPVNVSVYLEGDADGVFNLVRTVNDRSIKALGASPLRAY